MKQCIALVSANNHRIPYPVYPLGISYLTSYLATYLPEYGVKVFDFNLGTCNSFADFLERNEFDLVGISLRNFDDSTHAYHTNPFIAHYREIMRVARTHTAAPVVIGGTGFSVFPELIFNELNPDYAILGEGEAALKELIVALRDGSDPTAIDRLAWRDAGGAFRINVSGKRPGTKTNYISSPALHVENDWAEYYWKAGGMLNIQTKRGCPYNCIFCSYPLIDGRSVRTLDAKTVVANIEELYFAKGISYLFFTDSIFNIHRDYNEELARRLIESRADVHWGAYFAPHNLTVDDLKLYQQSGLTHVEFGSDSLSDRQLEHYNK
ncbi:MAG: cobalamin-dependent protein, partial [Tannerella sp.]|nr:cobalamin-dependent protein [Tannerella sp.]